MLVMVCSEQVMYVEEEERWREEMWRVKTSVKPIDCASQAERKKYCDSETSTRRFRVYPLHYNIWINLLFLTLPEARS